MMARNPVPQYCRQRGMVLVTALLMLVVVTLLAVSMFRSFGLDEKIAGNVREKQRALAAAETAEQYAEAWLAAGSATTPVACSTMVSSSVGQICTVPPADPTLLPWTAGVNYVYAASTATTMNTTTSGPNYFSQVPAYYIALLGTNATSTVYQIDAVGYSASSDTAAVVEATYAISASTQCKSCGQ